MTDVDPKARIAGVFDRAAPTYEQTGVEFFGPPGRKLVALAGIRPGERVLDLGCGRGSVLFPAAVAVGPTGSVVGLDLAPAMIAATTAAAGDFPWVRVTSGDAEYPDFPAGSFDVLTAGFLVFLLPDPAAAVSRWARLLRPGGRLAISTFTRQSAAGEAFYQDRQAALRPFQVPDPELDRRPTGADPSDDAEWVAALVAGAGLVDAELTEITVRSVYPSADAYWDWMLSAGSRRQLEGIPPDRHPQARAALAAVIDRHLRQPGGGYAKESGMRLTVARKPG